MRRNKKTFQYCTGPALRSEFAVSTVLADVRSHLNAISPYSDEYAKLFQRTESIRLELDDIIQEIERSEDDIEFDPERTEQQKRG